MNITLQCAQIENEELASIEVGHMLYWKDPEKYLVTSRRPDADWLPVIAGILSEIRLEDLGLEKYAPGFDLLQAQVMDNHTAILIQTSNIRLERK